MPDQQKPILRFPEGSVQALSAASATIFSINLGFFGLWAFQSGAASDATFNPKHLAVILPVIFALFNLGTVPLAATTPIVDESSPHDGLIKARRKFLAGVLALIVAVTIAAAMDFSRKF